MRTSVLLAATLVLANAPAAASVTLFSQNFDSLPAASPAASLPNFSIIGAVDVVQDNTLGIRCAGNAGGCLDLDGGAAGRITSTPIALGAGRTITFSFDLSGNQRDQLDDIFFYNLQLGGVTDVADFTCIAGFSCAVVPFIGAVTQIGPFGRQVPAVRGWESFALSFRPLQDTTLTLVLGTLSTNGVGPVLDNVRVTSSGAVPEPASWAMLIAGFGLAGALARQRRRPATGAGAGR